LKDFLDMVVVGFEAIEFSVYLQIICRLAGFA
jgi:hypothetical protein